jgi:hypothetical protein
MVLPFPDFDENEAAFVLSTSTTWQCRRVLTALNADLDCNIYIYVYIRRERYIFA